MKGRIFDYSIKNTCFNVSVHFSKYWCFDCLKNLKYSEHVFFFTAGEMWK